MRTSWGLLTEGQTPTPALLDRLLTSRPGRTTGPADGVNFTQFLAMMGERLLHLDREHDLLEAFACFDEGDKGWVKVDEVSSYLREMGDRMDDGEVSWAVGCADVRLRGCSRGRILIARGGSIMSSGPRC